MFHYLLRLFGTLLLLMPGQFLVAAELQHPVFEVEVTANDRELLEQSLAPILQMSDEKLASLVPERNGLSFCGCPNCDAGAQDRQMEWLSWRNPDSVRCKYCRMVFPNDLYPEHETRTAVNPRGEKVTHRYFRDDSGVYFFSARARYERKVALSGKALQLAKLAYLTKNSLHERKAVVLLNAFGERYPGWCVMSDHRTLDQGPLDSYPIKPREYYGGIWRRWFYNDIPSELLLAYDLVHDSTYWQELSAIKGLDVRKRLEDEVFRAAVDFVRCYDETSSNKSPGIFEGLIIAGRVLGEPDYVHDAVGRFRRLMRSQFFFDGMWREGSPSYHRMALQGLQRAMKRADGYSDPDGYRWKDGEHFERLDLVKEFPFLKKVMMAKSALVFPNGRLVAVHDAWASEQHELIEPPRTRLLPAMEHCCLHHGDQSNQLQARLQFASGNSHAHQDLLSLILWAGQRELLSDIGYTHTAYRRAWARSTPAHNTVVVNEAEQQTNGDRCDVTLFDTAEGLLHTVEAEGPAAYPNITSEYRRNLVLVEVSPEQAYVVDIFRVAGGRQHDWFLHGSADYDQAVTTSLEMRPVEGTLLGPGASFRMPLRERDPGDAGGRNIAYAFIRDLAQRETSADWSATFRFENESPIQLRTTVLGQPGTTVVRARCPSIRRANEDESKLDDFTMPVIVARRRGQDLPSTFVAIHEPFRKHPFITRVRNLSGDHGPAAPVVLQVEREGQRDILILANEKDSDEVMTIPGDPSIEFAGRMGFVRLRGKEVLDAYLLDGTRLRCGEAELMAQPAPAGHVAGVMRENQGFGFHVNEKLPEGGKLAGRTVLVTLPDGARHAYPITRVESAASGSLMVLPEDPGFDLRPNGAVDFLYFPQREMRGPTQYRILTQTRWRQNG